MTREASGVYVALGARIKRSRKSRGATQTDLGQHVQLSRASVANVEAGRQILNVHQLLLIAEFLQVPPSSLLPTLEGGKAEAPPTIREAVENAISESVDYDEDEQP